VPVGADVTLEVRFEAVSEGVLATGTAIAPLAGECARCLDPADLVRGPPASRSSSVPPTARRDSRDRHDKHDRHDDSDEQDDEELHYLDGDLLNLEPVLRDAVVLALPMSRLCREDCPGCAPSAVAPLADAGPGHRHDAATDPRWPP